MFLGVCSTDLKLFTWPESHLVAIYKPPNIQVNSFAWNAEGSQIFCAQSNGSGAVIIPPTTIEDEIETLKTVDYKYLNAAAYTNNYDGTVAIGTSKGKIKIFDLESNNCVKEYKKVGSSVNFMEFLHEDTSLVVGCTNGQLILYDQSGQPFSTFEVPYSQSISGLTTHKNQNLIAAGSAIGYVGVWNAETGDLILINAKHSRKITGVQFCDNTLSSADVKGYFTTSDLKSKTIVTSKNLKVPISAFTFEQDSHELILGTSEGQIIRYDKRNMKEPISTLETHSTTITKIAFPYCLNDFQRSSVFSLQEVISSCGSFRSSCFDLDSVSSRSVSFTQKDLNEFERSMRKLFSKRKLEFEKKLIKKFHAMRISCCKNFIFLDNLINNLCVKTLSKPPSRAFKNVCV